MKAKQVIRIQEEIPDTHYFVYKTQKYPINFNFFVYSSKFFSKNQANLEQNKFINLIDNDEQIEISDKTIQEFIKYVHREPIEIDDDNVSILNYLANKYEIESLITYTQQYINQNKKDHIIQILIVNQNDPTINTTSYETFIANDLLYFINDDRLLMVKFPILHRILNRYEKDQSDEIIEFYFKCLDKFGRIASVLFTKVDFTNTKSEFFNRIIVKYSNVFDFHFADFSFINKIYEFENKLILKVKEAETKLVEQQEINKNLNDEIIVLKSTLNDHNKTISDLNRKFSLLLDEHEEQKEEIIQLKRNIDNMSIDITKSKKNEKIIDLMYQKGKEFNGIFKHLHDKTHGNIHDNETIFVSSNSIYSSTYHPKNLLDFEIDNYYHSKNENVNTYIRFDFNGIAIQLFSYSIKSHENKGIGHLKSWVIEASNDKINWEIIDQHKDDPSLNESRKVATFDVQTQTNKFYRYIQLRQIGPNWSETTNYYIFFYSIEFYGKLKFFDD